MSATPLADAQEGFAGGWNLNNSPRMAPNQYASALNARLTSDGDLSTRQGCRRYLASSLGASIIGGFSWRQAGSTSDLVVANGHLFTALANSWGGGNGQYLSLTDRGAGLNTTLTSSVFTNPRVSFAHFRDGANECVYMADGLASLGGGAFPLSKWDGTTFSPHAVGPSGIAIKFVWVYNQRLFGVTGIDQTLYWSALNNGDTLGNAAAGGGFATVRTFGAQALIGGATIGNTNFLWHNGAISMFRGTTFDDINIAAGVLGLAGDIGVCSPFCVVPFDGYAFILTPRGAYLLTATGSLQAFDKPNQPDPTLRDPVFEGGLASFGAYNWMVHNARYQEVWFGMSGSPSSSSFAPIYVYNYRFGCWVGKFGYALPGTTYLMAIWETLDVTRVPQLIIGCSDGFPRGTDFTLGTSGETYLDDVNSDGTGGTVFNVAAQCRRLWSADQPSTKQWRETEIAATLNGNTTLQLTPTIQGSTLPAIAIQQPTYLANGKPGYYHVATGGDSQYMDAAFAWQSTPKLSLHRVETNVKGLGNRGVGRPDSAGSGTLPNAVSDLVLWLKADALSLSDGAGVTTWTDSSVSGNNATQSNASKKPLYKISIVNGRPVVRFDGIDDELPLTANILGSVLTVIVVQNKSVVGSGFEVIMRLDDFSMVSRFPSAGDQWGTYENVECPSGVTIGATFAITSVVHRARNDIDMVTNGTLVHVTSGTGGTLGSIPSVIGSSGGSLNAAGDFAEIIIYARALATAERRGVEAYLSAKYGITVV